MSENVIQPSFASGELSPSLFARVDISKYHSGAARMRNFFVDYRSGASTRAGTRFVMPGDVGQVRLVRFQQSVDVTYVLVFEEGLLRFISNGGVIVEPSFDLVAINEGMTTTIQTIAPTGWAVGDLVFLSGSTVPQANDRYFVIGGSADPLFGLVDPFTGAQVDSSAWNPYAGGGVIQRVFSLSTPWGPGQLDSLKFSQNASVMNITSPFTIPYTLTLISATNWVLTPAVFGSTIGPPAAAIATGSIGPANYNFAVTAVDSTNQESGPVNASALNVLDLRITSGTIQVSWAAVAGAVFYNIYSTSPSYIADPGVSTIHGFMGSVNDPGLVFFDSNIDPDFGSSPPIPTNPFVGVDAFPQVSAYFQQRLVYANFGDQDVDRFIMSRPGQYYNFDVSNPSQADDSVDARLVSLEVNEIKSMIPMPSGLIMLTTRGAWQVSGGAGGVATQGGPITPLTLTATSQAYIGANDVPPILINYDIYYVQQKGSIVRDLTYNIYANIYTGNDISIMSSHLFYGHEIREWAYQEEPFKAIWCVREDGILLSLTTVKEQEMYGWARHDTLGNFKSICTVTEGTTDAVYVVVERPLPNGNFIKMIERMAERTFEFGAESAFSSDAGLQTDFNHPNDNLLASFSVPANVVGGSVSFSAFTPGTFATTLVGDVIRTGGGKATVNAVISSQVINCTITTPFTDIIPDDPLNRPNEVRAGTWSVDTPFNQIFGLSHLEGQQVSVLADGGVINGLVVRNGTVTLPGPVTTAIIGLGFQAQLQTMYLDLGQESNSVQGKRKKINALTVRVKDSRGLKAGRTFNTLVPIKELNRTTILGQSIPLVTADERIIMDPLWDVPGQVCLQVDDPLPSTILGVVPEITIGDTPK